MVCLFENGKGKRGKHNGKHKIESWRKISCRKQEMEMVNRTESTAPNKSITFSNGWNPFLSFEATPLFRHSKLAPQAYTCKTDEIHYSTKCWLSNYCGWYIYNFNPFALQNGLYGAIVGYEYRGSYSGDKVSALYERWALIQLFSKIPERMRNFKSVFWSVSLNGPVSDKPYDEKHPKPVPRFK